MKNILYYVISVNYLYHSLITMTRLNSIIFSVKKDFVSWLNDEMNKRGWSNSELHRRSGMATSTISMILGGQNKPGWDFCLAIANALGEPPEKVFRLANLLPPLPASEDEQIIKEVMDIVKNMTLENRQDLLNYARYRYQQQGTKREK
jgi:transcriptional regulator with XRE-family HTH domain